MHGRCHACRFGVPPGKSVRCWLLQCHQRRRSKEQEERPRRCSRNASRIKKYGLPVWFTKTIFRTGSKPEKGADSFLSHRPGRRVAECSCGTHGRLEDVGIEAFCLLSDLPTEGCTSCGRKVLCVSDPAAYIPIVHFEPSDTWSAEGDRIRCPTSRYAPFDLCVRVKPIFWRYSRHEPVPFRS